MLSSEKYDLHGFFARLEEIHPFSQPKSFEVGCLKKGALVAIWVEFDQRSCRSSEIGPMSLRKNVNKPGLVSVLNQKRCSVVCRAQKSMICMGVFLPLLKRYTRFSNANYLRLVFSRRKLWLSFEQNSSREVANRLKLVQSACVKT